jgi:hypothetical protein
MSQKEISGAVGSLQEMITETRESIRAEKEKLARQKGEIDQKIAKNEAKAKSYRNKKEKYARIKEGRPLPMEVGAEPTAPEGTIAYETSRTSNEVLGSEEVGERENLTVAAYIVEWNVYLNEKYGRAASANMINQADFLRTTKLREDSRLDFKDFQNILRKYHKLRKMPTDRLDRSIDEFFELKIQTEK